MSSPIICQICDEARATEVGVFVDGSMMALCDECLEKSEEFIVNVGCLAD